ncbi:MAG: amidohydrolase family protein, partial [Acidimicrobiia bacterium]
MSTLLIRAGRIASTEFDAVLVRNGLIDAIGRSPDFAGRAEETLDFPNQWITYGLHDHHFHPLGYAAAVNGLSLHAAEDLDDLYDRLRLAADRLDPHLAVIGTRLNEESMAEQRLPTRADLDRAVPTRPVLLYRYCGHVAVANSAALHLAGFQSETGLLREQEIQIVANPLAELQPALEVEAVHTALAGLAGLGLTRMTAIVSAGDPIWCGSRDEIDTLLAVAPSLPMDFEILVAASSPEELEAAAIRIDGAASNLSFLG